MWNVTDWKKVVFSDESRFVLGTDDNRVRVWRRPAYDSRSTLIVMRGTLTGQRYVDDILRPHVGPFLNGLPGAIFQHDNARPHTAVVSQDFLPFLDSFMAGSLYGLVESLVRTSSKTMKELWFQQDGATCHTARATIDLLKDTFGDRLISRFAPVKWPPRSCVLTPLDYFLWGYVKSLVYADKPQTLDHLEDNIRRVIADIRP
ncbi:transposable element Tcb2 transposase [Trichonephila clavipes]|nr:transposable element Tcb2 transposase [Trichonephila clavipes]